MKPLGVLVLVLVAVGGLFFAIGTLGGKSETTDPNLEGISGTEDVEQSSDVGAGNLVDAGSTEREVATGAPTEPTERVEASPTNGSVFDNVVTGFVVDQNQAPIGGAQVTLTRGGLAGMMFTNEKMDRSKDRTAVTSDEGKYVFLAVEPFDQYTLEADADGYSRGDIAGISIAASGTMIQPSIMLGKGASLVGKVTDSQGNAVPDAVLRLDGMFSRMDGQPAADSLTTTTDGQGQYVIPNVPAGNRNLSVRADGYANQSKNGLVFRGETLLTMDLNLDIAEMICGKIISKGGSPIEGAKVLAINFSNSNRRCRDEVLTDANGEFCLTHVAAGQYGINVTADGYQTGHENRVKAGSGDLIIELAEHGVVSGRVVAGTDVPTTPYTIQLRMTYPGNQASAKHGEAITFSESDGSFQIECKQTGTFVVEATAYGYAPSQSEEIRFTIGQPLNGVTVHLREGGSITGSVVDAEGKPIANPRITTHPNDWTDSLFDRALGDQFPTDITTKAAVGNAEGKFTLANLGPATYQLRIRAAGFCESINAGISVTEGSDNAIGKIQLIRGGEISGTVIDLAGQPVPGASIRLNPDGPGGNGLPSSYDARAGGDGKYVISNIQPGKYKLSAALDNDPTNLLMTFASELDNVRDVKIVDGQTQHFELKIDS